MAEQLWKLRGISRLILLKKPFVNLSIILDQSQVGHLLKTQRIFSNQLQNQVILSQKEHKSPIRSQNCEYFYM